MDKNETNKSIALFEGHQIRREWHDSRWYLSVIDIIKGLTGSTIPRRYWSDLKTKLQNEGSEVYEKIVQLKTIAEDGKSRETDMADHEIVLRIIQSIPSPKAEPFKLWLAQLGKERIEEIKDPELAVNRAKAIYEKKGYPKSWIDKRMRGINVRNTLTDEWKQRGVKAGNDFAILTDEIYKGTFDMTAQEYKDHKDLDRENNLRDHMGDLELIFTMLGEASTTSITKGRNSIGVNELHKDAKDGGSVAGRARKDLEKVSGKPVVSEENFLPDDRQRLN